MGSAEGARKAREKFIAKLKEKYGDDYEEKYRQHMRDIASFKPSIESIEKTRATTVKRHGAKHYQRAGKLGGRPNASNR